MLQLDTLVQNARLDAIRLSVGRSPILELRTGNAPEACASPDTGEICGRLQLPADWMREAAYGSIELVGQWSVVAAQSGKLRHFRIKRGDGTCAAQGSVGRDGTSEADGTPWDMTVDNPSVEAMQQLTIVRWVIDDGSG